MAFDNEVKAKLAANTRNLLHSVVLIGGIGLIMAVCAWLLWGRPGVIWSFALILGLLLLSPRIAPEIIMRMYGARRVTPLQGAPVLRVVAELSGRAGLPAAPVLYIIPSPVINAFATGTRSDSILAITQGLLNRLNPRELSGVLAHEIAHIRHNDLWIMNLADTMSRFTHFMSIAGVFLFLFSLPIALMGGQGFPWLGILLLYFAPTASNLLQLGLSRAREYEADLEGARLSGDPGALASALHKIESYQGRIWENIFMPGRNVPVPSLLRTHPPTEERIRRLLALRKPPRSPLEVPELGGVAAHFTPRRERPRYHLTGLWH
ncbi:MULTISPECIES: zinc metalloprotease HtpX [Rhodomicrobium]|uniref:zinc metalloprotease HtpX n=1 Tax=Rhodomicrobium TaxID=1068 RepID=UPI000B4A6ABF|nr:MULTISPECIES: zinc metalloprotease HtpX [Rhodomicrobium]